MKPEDTPGSNHENKNPPPLPPELEARVVAWVLGEASAFEAAELERRCAELPELAVFKRRIEAVHGLVGEAERPTSPELKLSEDRRTKLLQTIRRNAGSATPAKVATLPTRSRTRIPAWARWSGGVSAAAAAVIVIGFTLSEASKPRPDPSMTLPGPAPVGADERALTAHALAEEGARRFAAETNRGELEAADIPQMVQAAISPAPPPAPAVQTAVRGDSDVLRQGELPRVTFGAAPVAGSASASPGIDPISPGNQFSAAGPSEPAPSETVIDAVKVEAEAERGHHAVASAATRARSNLSPADQVRDQVRGNLVMAIDARGQAAGGGAAEKNAAGSFAGASASAPVSMASGTTPLGGTLSTGGNAIAGGTISPASDSATWSYRVSPADDQARSRILVSGGERLSDNSTIAPAPAPITAPPVPDQAITLSAFTVSNERAGPARAVAAAPRPAAAKKAAEPDRPLARSAPPVDEALRAEIFTATQPVSTFSLHVSNVSYRLARAALERGQRPDAGAIRPEEFYNAFDYGDPAPVAGEPVAARIEQAAHPFLQQRNLVRVAMKVPATGRNAAQPLQLTVLLDTSGSMERDDRVASVRRAFDVLASLLGPNDRVTLIGFARTPRLLADRLPGNAAKQLNDIVRRTPSEGGTNLEEALKLAGDHARANHTPGAQNRIVLVTDGAANLGNADPAQLAGMVSALRQQGIAFDACGVGLGDGFDDTVLEALTRQGDGRYYAINSPEEVDAKFARQLAGAFRPAARDVKAQVRFNPARVRSYRLIGFEQHRLREEDFRNDAIDAAELAAGEAAVALYQVEVIAEGEGELGEAFVRFRRADSSEVIERKWTLPFVAQPPAFARATPSLQLAGSAALLAEKLRGGPPAGVIRLGELAPVVNRLRTPYGRDPRVREFITVFAQARRIAGD